jgi:hypothetical protein
MRVEVRLRVPNMKERALDENGYPIDHSSVRFRKQVDVPTLPKAQDRLELSTQSGRMIPAIVVRTDWYEGRGNVLSCQFARRAITLEEYRALADDPEWELKHLLE